MSFINILTRNSIRLIIKQGGITSFLFFPRNDYNFSKGIWIYNRIPYPRKVGKMSEERLELSTPAL